MGWVVEMRERCEEDFGFKAHRERRPRIRTPPTKWRNLLGPDPDRCQQQLHHHRSSTTSAEYVLTPYFDSSCRYNPPKKKLIKETPYNQASAPI